MSDKVTLRQILDLIDNSRESEEIVALMDCNGNIQCKAMVCSMIWQGIEDKTVNSIESDGSVLRVWLDD